MKCHWGAVGEAQEPAISDLTHREKTMPKLKTSRSARKRFVFTASGKIRRRRSGHGHLLTKKNRARKRRLRTAAPVSKGDEKRLRRILGK
jgi:large subunit ribosomal protein L35